VQHIPLLAQIPGRLVNRVAAHLRHPLFGGVLGDTGQTYATGLKMQEEQNVVSDQTSPRQQFDGEEVGTGQHRQMRCDEVFPGRVSASFPCRRNAVSAKYVAHRLIREFLSKVGKGSHDPS
jgi:hypothetical protein